MVEGVALVMPRRMSHRGEGLEKEMNEGGEEYGAVIGGRTVCDRLCEVPGITEAIVFL